MPITSGRAITQRRGKLERRETTYEITTAQSKRSKHFSVYLPFLITRAGYRTIARELLGEPRNQVSHSPRLSHPRPSRTIEVKVGVHGVMPNSEVVEVEHTLIEILAILRYIQPYDKKKQ